MLAAHKEKKVSVLSWLVVTLLLGAAFLGMELSEFSNMIAEAFWDWTTTQKKAKDSMCARLANARLTVSKTRA